MSIDLSIDFTSQLSAFAQTQFQIYFLQNMPSINDGADSFVSELYDKTVNGYVVKTVT